MKLYDLVGGAEAEFLDLEAAVLLHISVEALHVHCRIGVSAHRGVRDRVVVIGPAAVDGLAERQDLRRLGEAAEGVFFTVADDFLRIEFVAAGVVVVIMAQEHIVHVGDGGIDPRDIAGNPFAGTAFRARKQGDGLRPPAQRIEITAVQQHRRPVRENQEHRFRHSGINEVDLELPFFPSRPLLAGKRVLAARRKGLFPVRQPQGGPAQE